MEAPAEENKGRETEFARLYETLLPEAQAAASTEKGVQDSVVEDSSTIVQHILTDSKKENTIEDKSRPIKMKTYNYEAEVLNPEDPALNAEAGAAFSRFVEAWADKVDLRDPASIEAAHEAASEAGLFSLAERARDYYFGKNVHTYGVVYLSDLCVEGCEFCPAGIHNREYKSRTLSTKELVADIAAVLLQGHEKVCFLQANWKEAAFLAKVGHWLPEVIKTCGPLGLKELILNVQTLSEAGYRKVFAIRDAVDPAFTIQVRTFQETYDREAYAALIPEAKGGVKHDFTQRRDTQKVAWKAGADSVGLGVLFGLSPKPLEELQKLIEHAKELQSEGAKVVRICLPTAHSVDGLKTSIPFDLPTSDKDYPHFAELVYSLARLALPEMNWVMSERDPAEVRDQLVKYASETTVGVHPGVGDNLDLFLAKERGLHFEQATVYSEEPDQYVERMAKSGYTVKMDASTERREKIRNTIHSLVLVG
ncbi:MAG TPA: hypothetical protein VJJ47_02945 [Candidatus Paceibacterota bacterium]